MTVLLAGTQTALNCAGLVTGAATGATSGCAVSIIQNLVQSNAVGSLPNASVVAGSAGAGGSAGAIMSAAAVGELGAAAVGGVTGMASGAVCSHLISNLSGPLGSVVLGASESAPDHSYSFDCWKQILHETSPNPSLGKPLRELLQDVRVKQAAFTKETIKTELKGKINLTENSPFSTALVKVYAH